MQLQVPVLGIGRCGIALDFSFYLNFIQLNSGSYNKMHLHK